MSDYYAFAYLDDYHLIRLSLSRRIENGHSEQFYLVLNEQIISLDIIEHKDRDDFVDYQLTFTEELVIGQPYEVVMVNGFSVPLTYRKIVKTARFNEEFYYGGSDLGAVVHNGMTSFKLWAPTSSEVILVINEKLFKMMRTEKGVYCLTFKADLTGSSYYYIVTVNGYTYKTIDPYAKASQPNSQQSVVVSLENVLSSCIGEENEIIYELSVRDFSKEATFQSLIDQIGYLKDLGVTTVQLLPVNDFGSVNEYHKQLFYNWGYDPVQYQCLEGSYSSDPSQPLLVLTEFKEMVNQFHQNQIKVVLDVVFNHHYYAQRSSFNRTVPYYFYRIDDQGEFVDGTGCGSECDSTMLMERKYIVDTILYYINKFDVDGFRFDLMNFIDIETMNLAYSLAKKVKPSILFYGEGWKINAGVSLDILSHYDNAEKLEGIGLFNDHFRDVMKGSTFDLERKGYGSGDLWQVHQAAELIKGTRFTSKKQSINYVECHDNATLYDKLKACCPFESQQQWKQRVKFINALTLLAQGVSFLHAGQEHCYSKEGLTNTYNGPEYINQLTQEKRAPYQEVIDYVKAIIQIKKKYQIGLNDDCEVTTDHEVIIYQASNLWMVINPSIRFYTYRFDSALMMIHDGQKECEQLCEKEAVVPPISIVILERVKNND